MDARKAAVAGLFYPASPRELRETVTNLLSAAPPQPPARVVVCPHAGYSYSGQLAAVGFRSLQAWPAPITRVAILGPNHRVPWRGMCLSGHDAFTTPLGIVPIDGEGLTAARALGIPNAPAVHAEEHCYEVELPFLQTILPEATVLPIVVGHLTDYADLANFITDYLSDPHAAVVISSDLSHFLTYEEAQLTDKQTLTKARSFSPLSPTEACGAHAWNGLTRMARATGLEPLILAQANSADAGGDRARVVGYAAVAYQEVGERLPAVAREEIAAKLTTAEPGASATDQSEAGAQTRASALRDPAPLTHPWLAEPGAAFVTLNKRGQLRGCIGSLLGYRPLLEDVRENALAAAFRDPRFDPLTLDELAELEIEVSVLSSPQLLGNVSRTEALSALRPGRDGIIIRSVFGRATFLPQVWEQLPDPEEFLAQLERKAGWFGGWPEDAEVLRYSVRAWVESQAQ